MCKNLTERIVIDATPLKDVSDYIEFKKMYDETNLRIEKLSDELSRLFNNDDWGGVQEVITLLIEDLGKLLRILATGIELCSEDDLKKNWSGKFIKIMNLTNNFIELKDKINSVQ